VKPKPSTLEAHVALDGLLACHQRLRELLKAAQNGEYTRAAFAMSCSDIFSELFVIDLQESFAQVASQLKN
jgi:hypothetical protein